MRRAVIEPTFELEERLIGTYGSLACVDEVGRGALAGPVCVGIAVVDMHTSPHFPQGLRDSKMLTARRREELVEPVKAWVADWAVGWASNEIVDRYGIIQALRWAASDAVTKLTKDFHAVLLDGSANWWDSSDLFAPVNLPEVPVVMQVKGDAHCGGIAGASVLAKVMRDAYMVDVEDPGYGFAAHKGYSSPKHIAALGELGPSPLHRRSWKLPGLDS